MKQEKPIVRTKPSNRRCVNCIHYPERVLNPEYDPVRLSYLDREKPFLCHTAGKAIDYWNCCRQFQWNPKKTYTD